MKGISLEILDLGFCVIRNFWASLIQSIQKTQEKKKHRFAMSCHPYPIGFHIYQNLFDSTTRKTKGHEKEV
jgi:hypothetical protein